MAELKFVDTHNEAVDFTNVPADKRVYRSLFNGLKNCCLSHALIQKPDKCSICINDFWMNTKEIRLRKDGEAIDSMVPGIPVTVTEQTIREVLKLGDQPHFPSDYC